MNELTGKTSKQVLYFDASKSVWRNGLAIPEGRQFSKAIQVDNKLIVTLGGNDQGKCPANIIFDGKVWSVSKSTPVMYEDCKEVYG